MPYIKTFDRDQMMFCSWDSFVDPESTARIIDAFVNSLDLEKYGVKAVAVEGRPSYEPKGMFKLYIYGYNVCCTNRFPIVAQRNSHLLQNGGLIHIASAMCIRPPFHRGLGM